ncbi:PREDICTED: uncharacterized protein LOC104791874 [Camelina sativa]|uniref:Uncharacterized protein LOC104791874 n=1 Tax=Camelina sativa TaxID=90675 RepID=A0ABM0ZIE5_CAMSA|nr:PREDICTED: uncharacterized protein LOC104791874 [Camelina sativa]
MKKPYFLKNPVFFLLLLITLSSLTILIFSFLKLPETPLAAGNHLRELRYELTDEVGYFGKMMIEMLPEDLVFTAFVPSDRAFRRDLGLKSNNSRQIKSLADDDDEDGDNTYAVVSRIMGFAVVPYKVEEADIRNGETASYESLSGFTLKIWRKRNSGGLVVNGIETEKMGFVKRGKIIAHIMNGVVMDSDFAQSLASSTPQDEDEEP